MRPPVWMKFTEGVMLWQMEYNGKEFICVWCRTPLFRPASTLCAKDFTRAAQRHQSNCKREKSGVES